MVFYFKPRTNVNAVFVVTFDRQRANTDEKKHEQREYDAERKWI